MNEMVDKSGMFKDFNFKLVVISSILEKEPSFEEELIELRKKYVAPYEWYVGNDLIEEMVSYFEELRLTEEDLEKVTEICFDGGEEIYMLLQPDWGGDSDIFDVTSVEGFEVLKNLKRVDYISMCEPELMEAFTQKGIEVF